MFLLFLSFLFCSSIALAFAQQQHYLVAPVGEATQLDENAPAIHPRSGSWLRHHRTSDHAGHGRFDREGALDQADEAFSEAGDDFEGNEEPQSLLEDAKQVSALQTGSGNALSNVETEVRNAATLSGGIHTSASPSAEGCINVFLDVGSNAGTHIRKLFEPEKYPAAEGMLNLMQKHFGPPELRKKGSSGLCAFAFEANPKFNERLNTIATTYQCQGWRTQVFVQRAVADSDDQPISFFVAEDASTNDWGSSAKKEWPGSHRISNIKTLDLAAFMLKFGKKTAGTRVMKMDIEGSEFKVLQHMMDAGVLCKSFLDTVIIEWHYDYIPENEKLAAKFLMHRINDASRCPGDTITNFLNMDDETYLLDGQELPDCPSGEKARRQVRGLLVMIGRCFWFGPLSVCVLVLLSLLQIQCTKHKSELQQWQSL